jgi:hypothetical protein
VKEVVLSEVNIILIKVGSLCKTVNEQLLIETIWFEVVSGRFKRDNSSRCNNIYRIPVIKNHYRLPCVIEASDAQIFNSAGNQETRKLRKKQTPLEETCHCNNWKQPWKRMCIQNDI